MSTNDKRMIRLKVYQSIDTERNYQEQMKEDNSRPDIINDFHVGDTLSAIQYNLNKATDAWYKGSVPHEDAMNYLRKIAALCVQAGEEYGMPEREVVTN